MSGLRGAAEWWELEGKSVRRSLVDADRAIEILQLLLAEVTEVDVEILLLVLEEGLRRLRDEDLTSVPGRPDPRRPMDGEPGVATARCSRLARVQAHANLDLHAFRPGVRRDRELALDRRQERISALEKATKKESPWVSTS